LITDNTWTIESKFVNSRTIDNVSNFIFGSNNYLPIQIENGDRRYVIFKTSNECKNNFEYFDKLNKTFTHEFYNELYNYFINRDLTDFNPRSIPITDIKNDMIESCKESWLLFFEDNISKFMKKYQRKLAYFDYVKFCKDENYLPFSKTKFGLKLKNVVNCYQTTKDSKTVRYYLIKDDVKAGYEIENEVEVLDE
jgi:hypothetical protein